MLNDYGLNFTMPWSMKSLNGLFSRWWLGWIHYWLKSYCRSMWHYATGTIWSPFKRNIASLPRYPSSSRIKSSTFRESKYGTYHQVLVVWRCITTSLCQAFDGVRRRVFPSLYKALVAGTPDHRVKGALWQINMPTFANHAMMGMLIDQFWDLLGWFECY